MRTARGVIILLHRMFIAGSSNGRTIASGAIYLRSNRSPAAYNFVSSLGVYLARPLGITTVFIHHVLGRKLGGK